MTLNSIFADGMVFQAGAPIRIFGEGGGKIKAEINGAAAEENISGTDFVIELPPLDYGGPYTLTLSLDGRQRKIYDVYVGDVYLISGQSNMQFKLCETENPAEHIENTNVRLYSTTRVEGGERFTPSDGWVKGTRDAIGDFSAIGYMAARHIQEKTHHVIGLVSLYQGAAAIQCFLPPYVFTENPRFVLPMEKRYDNGCWWNRHLSLLYDFSLKKISPFSFGAVVWYQGESNCSVAESDIYYDMLTNLVASWRKELRSDDLPFVIIQIHDFDERNTESWHKIQRAQTDISKNENNIVTVITKDVSETDVIHPKRKEEVARRVAAALAGFSRKK